MSLSGMLRRFLQKPHRVTSQNTAFFTIQCDHGNGTSVSENQKLLLIIRSFWFTNVSTDEGDRMFLRNTVIHPPD
jgi:hypothetical protein